MRPLLAPLTLVLAAASLPGTASAAGTTSLTIGSATMSGSTLTVTGASTYADQPFVLQGDDPVGDTVNGLPGTFGQDLTGAGIASNTNGTISFRWTASELPPVLNGSPQLTYGWTFCAGPVEEDPEDPQACWELTASRMNWFIPNPEPWLQVWSCASTCDGSGLTNITGPLVFDGATKTVTATLSRDALSADPGDVISPLLGFSFNDGALWTGMAGWYLAGQDFINYEDTYTVPGKRVSLAIAEPGQDPATVTYGTDATVAQSGSYTGSLDVSTLAPGSYTVYSRACYGANNCAYATSGVTI